MTHPEYGRGFEEGAYQMAQRYKEEVERLRKNDSITMVAWRKNREEVERLRDVADAAKELLRIQTVMETIWPPKKGEPTGTDYARAWMNLRQALEEEK